MEDINENSSLILSWNCGGLKNKKSFLETYTMDHRPLCIAIQETKLKKESNFNTNISNYSYIDKKVEVDRNAQGGQARSAQGGVAFYVHADVVYKQIKLNTNLQAIAITAYLHKRVTICNIYIKPLQKITQDDLENLTGQLQKPYILTGDFNAHRTLWDPNCKTPNKNGEIVEKFLLENDLNILDEDKYTYEEFRPDGHYTSHIDLTLITPDLQPDLDWTTLDDNGGSDHI